MVKSPKRLIAKNDGAIEAMRELSLLCGRSPDARAHVIRILNEAPDLLAAEIDGRVTVHTDEFAVIYKPSNSLRRALAAARAWDRKSIHVA